MVWIYICDLCVSFDREANKQTKKNLTKFAVCCTRHRGPLPCVRGRAHGKEADQRHLGSVFAVCRRICRVLWPRHTAKEAIFAVRCSRQRNLPKLYLKLFSDFFNTHFAVCWLSGHTAKFNFQIFFNERFAVCCLRGHTAKLTVTQPVALSYFCVPSAVPSARRHVLPCARQKAHGKEAVRRLALCRARFAVCPSRRKFCRVPEALCRVPQAHGKARKSGSDVCTIVYFKLYRRHGGGGSSSS